MYSSNSIFDLKATFLQAVLEMTIEIHFVHHLRHATVHRSYNRKSLASKQRSKTPRLHSKRRRGGHIFDSFSLTSKNQLVTLTPHKARRRRRVKNWKSSEMQNLIFCSAACFMLSAGLDLDARTYYCTINTYTFHYGYLQLLFLRGRKIRGS